MKKTSAIIVHHKNTKKSAEFLLGYFGELAKNGIPVNAIVMDEKRYANHDTVNKNALQKVIFLGYFEESTHVADNISDWKFDKFGIRYGWHGNRAIISCPGTLSEAEFKEMAAYAEGEVKVLEDAEKKVGKKGAKAGIGLLFGGLLAFLLGPLGWLAFGAKLAIGSVAGISALAALAATQDLEPAQIREQQRKFGVLYFCMKHLSEFLEIEEKPKAN